MKKHNILFVSILIFSFVSKAQLKTGTYSDYFREGSFLMQEENFDQALKILLSSKSSLKKLTRPVSMCVKAVSFIKVSQSNLCHSYSAKNIIDISFYLMSLKNKFMLSNTCS